MPIQTVEKNTERTFTQVMAAFECVRCHEVRPYGVMPEPKEARLNCSSCGTATVHAAKGTRPFDCHVSRTASGHVDVRFTL